MEKKTWISPEITLISIDETDGGTFVFAFEDENGTIS